MPGLKGQLIKATGLLASGSVAGKVVALATTIVLARMLAREDFGIGAAIALAGVLIRMTSDFGFETMIVQARDGAADRLMGTAQTLVIARGLAVSLILFALAVPFAAYFGIEELAWAFRVIAITPAIQGFRHIDVARQQRELQFIPTTAMNVLPECFVLAAAYFLARALGDFRVFLAIGIARAVLTVITSHLFAERPFRVGWDGRHAARFLSFGWPLLVNGMLMFAVLQGDRAIVGRFFSLDALAAFAVAGSLTLIPAMLVNKTVNSVALPVLAKARSHPSRFDQLVRRFGILHWMVCLSFGWGAIAVGAWIVVLIYGTRYSDAGQLVVWLGVMQSLRLLRAVPTVAAMARGDTQLSMFTNVFRLIGFGLAALVAARGWPVVWVPLMGIVGELAANVAAIVLLALRHGAAMREDLARLLALAVLVIGFAAAMESFADSQVTRWILAAGSIVSLIVVNFYVARDQLGFGKSPVAAS